MEFCTKKFRIITQCTLFYESRTDEKFLTEKSQVQKLVTTERIVNEDSLKDEKSQLVQSFTNLLVIDTNENCKKEFKIITENKNHH